MSINVITAGPSAGKSSTIRHLSACGYRTLPEAARILFDQRISEGDDPDDVRKEDDFHEQVESISRKIEAHLPGVKCELTASNAVLNSTQLYGEDVFLDRSLADNLAYREHFGNADCDEYERVYSTVKNRYDNVFLLDRIEFVDDEVRSEDEEEASEIHRILKKTYEQMSCDVYEVPVIPIDERCEYILERV